MQSRFNWNLYPKTAKVIEAAELSSVQETQEVLDVYKSASVMFKREGGVGKLEIKTMKVHMLLSTCAINTRTKFKISCTVERLLLGLPQKQGLITNWIKKLLSTSSLSYIASNALAERNFDATMFCVNRNSALSAMMKSLTSSPHDENFCQFKIKSTASSKPSNMSVEKKPYSKKVRPTLLCLLSSRTSRIGLESSGT